MKSKTSFINKTMLQKNVKLYWPIWTLYTIVLLLNGPFSMWSRFKNAEFIYGKNWHKYMLDIISPAISMEADMIFIFYHISEVYRVDNYKLGKFKWMFISITYIHVYSSNQNLI